MKSIKFSKSIAILAIVLFTSVSCKDNSTSSNGVESKTAEEFQDYLASASIYEINTRQFSENGDFDGVTAQIPRLNDLGVDILWLMPIHPISAVKRKATDGTWVEQIEDENERAKYLGSPYAVGDYRAVNPDFGNMDDFKELLAEAHDNDMLVIIDWVPNHTGWDNPWISEHPEYYTQNDAGEIIDPIDPGTGKSWGWTDVADLNFDNQEMRQAMIDHMTFWLTDIGIDGFRVDVAHGVPVDFWAEASPQLRAAKDNVFLLAEAEKAEIAPYFDMSYAWSFHHLLGEVLRGEKPKTALKENVDSSKENFGANHTMMMFTTNHDENSWSGTVFDRYGDAHKAMAVLSFTLDGMPLIYSGQEASLNKRLKFFEKDNIDWSNDSLSPFYRQLLELKENNNALHNGSAGGELNVLDAMNDNVYMYERQGDENKVTVAINFSEFYVNYQNAPNAQPAFTSDDVSSDVIPPYGYAVWTE